MSTLQGLEKSEYYISVQEIQVNIERNSVVRFHYSMKDGNGDVLDSSDNSEPMTYLHGQDGLLKGLQEALEGKAVGDQLEVNLSPDQAFGERVDNAEQRVPLKHLAGAKKWKPGMTAIVHTENGNREVTVRKVGHTMATVDTNHPLAGKSLNFSVEVSEVRQATEEEIAHGHAHGPGGHHH